MATRSDGLAILVVFSLTRCGKRALDVIASAVGLLLALPILAAFATVVCCIAFALVWVRDLPVTDGGNLILAVVCGLIASLFFTIFHVKRVTLVVRVKNPVGFLTTCQAVLHELGVLLADHVVVLSQRPARLLANVPIDLPRPRNTFEPFRNPGFETAYDAVWTRFRSQLDIGRVH